MENVYRIIQNHPGATGQFVSGDNSQKCEAERIRKLYMIPSAAKAGPQYEIRVIGLPAAQSGIH